MAALSDRPRALAYGVLLALLSTLLLNGCGLFSRSDSAPTRKLDPNRIDDAVPRRDPITRAGNKNPYTVLGKTYRILPTAKGYSARGTASWYGTKFDGESTANGERYDLYGMTAAHCTLPIPTYVQVTNLENGKRCIVRVNDRGPFVDSRLIDLSYAAATKLGYAHKGTALVEVTAIDMDNWPPRNIAETPISTIAPSVAEQATVLAPSAPVALPIAAVPLTENVSGLHGAVNNGNNDGGDARIDSTTSAVARSADNSAVGGTVYIQVGAFANPSAAESLRARLARSTHNPVTVQPTPTLPVLYRVRIGPFANIADAERASELLRAQQIDGARIVDESRQ